MYIPCIFPYFTHKRRISPRPISYSTMCCRQCRISYKMQCAKVYRLSPPRPPLLPDVSSLPVYYHGYGSYSVDLLKWGKEEEASGKSEFWGEKWKCWEVNASLECLQDGLHRNYERSVHEQNAAHEQRSCPAGPALQSAMLCLST